MIKLKLSDLLGKHKMTQKALAELTGIRPGTISKMYYEQAKRLDISHLDSICSAFDCPITDLIEYLPDHDPDLDHGEDEDEEYLELDSEL